MPAECSLLLEVFAPVSIYEPIATEVDFEVSTDPAHPNPYLQAPRNYAEQEIDPIQCTATIGTVEVGVVDVPTIAGDQTTGWMTARVHDMLGRRCRLRRWVDDAVGWVVIADGPASFPKMDATYAAYRWTIRDTRDLERKLPAFQVGGTCGIIPRGPVYGFGEYTDDAGDHLLLPSSIENPLVGKYQIIGLGDYIMGLINLAEWFAPLIDLPFGPHSIAPWCAEPRLFMDEDAQAAVKITNISAELTAPRTADVIWRRVHHSIWNVARPAAPLVFPQQLIGTVEATKVPYGTDKFVAANYVILFVAPSVPEGFPTESDIDMEFIVRYRGPASDAFPYYVEDPLGIVIANLYSGVYSLPYYRDIDGFIYDPGGLDTAERTVEIAFDPNALDAMIEQVRLRQTEPADDVRDFAEKSLYAPSGWIPALDNNMQISPVSRTPPDAVDPALLLDDDGVAPQPSWQTGERTVSEIEYNYPRYFVPEPDALIETMPDGLAQRDVTIDFQDVESDLRYGPKKETYDASAFAAVGTPDGANLPGQLEQASVLCQQAKFDVLDRFRSGVQAIQINVLRSIIPSLRVGDWVPWDISYLPDRVTGLRGSTADIAQVVSIRDDDCTWRYLMIEESRPSDGQPGLVIALVSLTDEPSTGTSALRVISDVEHT